MIRSRLAAVGLLIGLVASVPLARAILPAVLVVEGVEVILASSAAADLPIAVAAGASASWVSGLASTAGIAAAYFALSDAGGNSLRVPISASPPAPSAPTPPSPQAWNHSHASGQTWNGSSWGSTTNLDFWWPYGNPFGSQACAAFGWGFTSTSGSLVTCDSTHQVTVGSVFGSENRCATGYSLTGSTCTLTATPREVNPDTKCDVQRSGNTYTYYADADCNINGNIKGTISGNKVEVVGKDAYNNPVIQTLTANSDGSTTLQQKVQGYDSAGNTQTTVKTATFSSDGALQSSSQTVNNQVLNINGATGTTEAATGNNLPDDYARQNTQEQIKDALTVKGDDVELPTESDPSSLFAMPGLDSLKAWTVPSHTGVCPTMTLPFYGHDLVMSSQCDLLEEYRATILAISMVGFVFVSLRIVLEA